MQTLVTGVVTSAIKIIDVKGGVVTLQFDGQPYVNMRVGDTLTMNHQFSGGTRE